MSESLWAVRHLWREEEKKLSKTFPRKWGFCNIACSIKDLKGLEFGNAKDMTMKLDDYLHQKLYHKKLFLKNVAFNF